MGSKASPAGNRKAQQRRKLVRHIIYVLNLMLGVATHSCELAAFGSYWVVPTNLAAPGVRIERELDNSQSINATQFRECPVPSPDYLLHPLIGI